MTTSNEIYVFADDLVITMAKLIQVAMLTGTDIYDHLRTVQCVVNDDGKITTSPDFSEKLETEIASMLERAQSLTKEG
tara:strand:- start:182 stop:415 length:234 start_codon:yes stop_codon:yes gene_type:complete